MIRVLQSKTSKQIYKQDKEERKLSMNMLCDFFPFGDDRSPLLKRTRDSGTDSEALPSFFFVCV